MKPTEAYSIDANVILRYVLADDPKPFAKARRIVQGVASGQTAVTCDPVNLGEIIWVLRSVYKYSNEEIVEGIEPIVGMEGFLMPNKRRYLLALRLFATNVRHFGDACACAAAIQACDGRLYSFDVGLSKVPGIARSESVP